MPFYKNYTAKTPEEFNMRKEIIQNGLVCQGTRPRSAPHSQRTTEELEAHVSNAWMITGYGNLSRRHGTYLFFSLERIGWGSFQDLFSTARWGYFVRFQVDRGLIFREAELPTATGPCTWGTLWAASCGQAAGAPAVIKGERCACRLLPTFMVLLFIH